MRSSVLFLFSLFALQISLFAQDTKVTEVHYLVEFPYAFEENGKLKGIEIEILNYFQNWLKEEKKIEADFSFTEAESFSKAYNASVNGKNVITAASVTITKGRKEEVDFSKPYLKNSTVFVSDMKVRTLRNYNEIPEVFEGKVALVRKGTTHEEEFKQIKALYFQDMIVKYVDGIEDMKELLKSDVVTEKNEEFGFAFSKDSGMAELFNEFFTSGFKFTSTEEYISILDAYLGPEIRESVQVK